MMSFTTKNENGACYTCYSVLSTQSSVLVFIGIAHELSFTTKHENDATVVYAEVAT